MSETTYISIDELCTHYEIEVSFFENLNEFGLIQIITIEQSLCIHEDHIAELEKMIRLHRELDINIEGIDTVINLLSKIESLEAKLIATQNRLRLYENDELI